MDKTTELLNWLTEFPFVKFVLNKDNNDRCIIFGGILRTIMETSDMTPEDSKNHIIEYFQNGGDIDIVSNRDNLQSDIGNFLKTMKKRISQFRGERLKQESQTKEIIDKINQKENIKILDIVHNYDDYLFKEMRKHRTLHFHAKILGEIVYNGRKMSVNIDLTEYRGDDKMKNLTYDFSTNMARALWNGEWNIDSRFDGLKIEQIRADVQSRTYKIIGGKRHIGTYRYFKMVRRGYWPEGEDMEIFMENVFNIPQSTILDHRETADSIVKYMFDHKDRLRKVVNRKSNATYNSDKILLVLVMLLSFNNESSRVQTLREYFSLFAERAKIHTYQLGLLMEYADLSIIELLGQMAEIVYDDGDYYNIIYKHVNDIGMLKFMMPKYKINKESLSHLAAKKHDLFIEALTGINEHILDPTLCMTRAIEGGNVETTKYLHSKYPTVLKRIVDTNGIYFDPEKLNVEIMMIVFGEATDQRSLIHKWIVGYSLSKVVDVLIRSEYKIDIFMVESFILHGLSAIKDGYLQPVKDTLRKIAGVIDRTTFLNTVKFLENLDHSHAESLYHSIPYEYRTRHGFG